MKLEINNGIKLGKFTNRWKLSNIFLNNQWIKDVITGKLESMSRGMKNIIYNLMGCNKSGTEGISL